MRISEGLRILISVIFVMLCVLIVSQYANATEFRLPAVALKGETLTAYISTGATEAIPSGTPYIKIIWRLNHVKVQETESTLLTGEALDGRWFLKDQYTTTAVGIVTLSAASQLGGVTFEHTESTYVDDLRTRITALAQIYSVSPITQATAIIVTGGTIIDRADAGWGTRLYPRYVPSGGQGETIQSGLVFNLDTAALETKYWADVFDFISVVTGTVQAKIRTPLFAGIDAINTHILAEAYPSGWGGTRTTENPSFAKP